MRVPPVKKPRKAEGHAAATAMATATAPWRPTPEGILRRKAMSEALTKAWLERIANPLTEEEWRQHLEEFLSRSWETFRDGWPCDFPFDDVTPIPCMRFTDADLTHPDNAFRLTPRDAMQIVSVQVRALTGGKHWPLDVYGFVAIHDALDLKRVMIYNRERKDCQHINKQDPYLRLTGPTRGVLINQDASWIEVVLKVKGPTEWEDEDLIKFATTCRVGGLHPIEYTSKLCTLELQHYTVLLSVEATVGVRVFQGQWPHGFRGVLNATTAGQQDIQIALLHLNDEELPVDDDGFIKLSRRVVSVECDGRLGVSLFENGVGEEGVVWFPAEKSRRATHYMYVKKFNLCLEVIVAWSLF